MIRSGTSLSTIFIANGSGNTVKLSGNGGKRKKNVRQEKSRYDQQTMFNSYELE